MDRRIVDEVRRAVLDQGQLARVEIMETWCISHGDYRELQGRVLAADKGIKKGPRGVGGLEVKPRRGRLPDEGIGAAPLLRSTWEGQTVARLSEVLSHGVLEHLLGPLLQTLRQARLAETGSDRRATRHELATALVIQHGIDLFGDPTVRKAIAKAVGVPAPDKWYPGKTAAIKFVAAAGLPRELAGFPAEDDLPDFE
jgi:hypothetical protein